MLTTDSTFNRLAKRYGELLNQPGMTTQEALRLAAYEPFKMELEHKIKLSAILALVLNNLRRENIRKANTLSKIETLGNKSHLQHRLESISCKSAGLNARKELIEHLLASPLVQEENGDISCECCHRTFKYHPAKKD